MGRKLFVLGHARSGTTIMRRLLNSSADFMLLGEAHLFESHWKTSFVSEFNARHLRTSKVKAKGMRLPAQFEGMLPEVVLEHLGQHYEWVGEKIAIGPMSGLGTGAASAALDYYAAHHLDGSYILTFRAPVASLKSLRWLFPRVSATLLLQGWMLSLVEIGAASSILSRVMLVPLELLSSQYWGRIQRGLSINGRADANWINPEEGKAESSEARLELATVIAEELGWEADKADQFLRQLSCIYERFVNWIDPETLYYSRPIAFESDVSTTLTEVCDMLAALSPAGPGRGSLPVSVCGWLSKGTTLRDTRVLPLSAERMQRFSSVLRDSLFCRAPAVVLADKDCPYALIPEGVDILREGTWLRLRALPDLDSHKSLLIGLPIEALTIATFRLRWRPGTGHGCFVMLQVGSAAGFFNAVFNCQTQEIASMNASGAVKSVLSHIQALADGDLQLSIAGMVTDGRDGYLRVYLCDDAGSIEFRHSDSTLMISDLVLGYGPEDCRLT